MPPSRRSVWVGEAIPDGAPGRWLLTAWSQAPGDREPHRHDMVVDETTTPKTLLCLCRSAFQYRRTCSAMRAWIAGTLGREPD